MAIKFDSIVLMVSDLGRSTEFYRDKLGMAVRYESKGFVALEAGTVPLQLESLDEAAETFGTEALLAEQQCGHRLAFTVRVDDVDATYKELKDKGVRFIKAPTDMPWGTETPISLTPMETYGYYTSRCKDTENNSPRAFEKLFFG